MDFNLLKAAAPLIMGAVAYCGAQMAAASLADWAEGWKWLKRLSGCLTTAGWVLTLVLVGFGLTHILGLDTRLVPAGIVLAAAIEWLVALVKEHWKGCLILTALLVASFSALGVQFSSQLSGVPVSKVREMVEAVFPDDDGASLSLEELLEGTDEPEAAEAQVEATAEAEAVDEPTQAQIEATEPVVEATAEATEEARAKAEPAGLPDTYCPVHIADEGAEVLDEEGKSLFRLKPNLRVWVIGRTMADSPEYKIQLKNGLTGWVASTVLKTELIVAQDCTGVRVGADRPLSFIPVVTK